MYISFYPTNLSLSGESQKCCYKIIPAVIKVIKYTTKLYQYTKKTGVTAIKQHWKGEADPTLFHSNGTDGDKIQWHFFFTNSNSSGNPPEIQCQVLDWNVPFSNTYRGWAAKANNSTFDSVVCHPPWHFSYIFSRTVLEKYFLEAMLYFASILWIILLNSLFSTDRRGNASFTKQNATASVTSLHH